MPNEKDFLGRGFRFPVSINLNGGVSSSQLEENVRQSLFVILGTAPGERINRPRFGCQIHDLMFAPNNPMTAARAEVYCEEAIYKFEPRIEKVACRARPNPDEPNRLDIRIEYVIRNTNDKRNLVFPFYLKTEEDEIAEIQAAAAQPGSRGVTNS
jgi:phage baseplate assembly protein W